MNNSLEIKIKKLSADAIIPTYGTDFSAGADLYSLLDTDSISIAPNETVFVHTGLTIEIPTGFVGLIFARSGLSCKRSLAPANKVGVIDSDYRGEIIVALHNHSDIAQTISNKERIAQISFVPYYKAIFNETDSLEDSSRGNGGFGSTGNK